MTTDNNNIRILFPVGSLYPAQLGGPCTSVYDLASELAARGASVSVVTTDRGIKPDHKIPRNSWIKEGTFRRLYCSYFWDRLPLRLIWASLRELPKTDIVHLTSVFYPPSLIIALLALSTGVKVVWSPRGEMAQKALRFRSTRKLIVLPFVQALPRKNLWFHATSKVEDADINHKFPGTGTILISNLFKLERPTSAVRTHKLLYLGRIHPIKGIDLLIRAVAGAETLLNQGYSLTIAGSGPQHFYRHLRTLVADLGLQQRVFFVGAVLGDAKIHHLASCRFLILPSHSENFGNVVVEALAQGTPVIASTGTPWSQLETYRAGYWTPNSVESLTASLNRIATMSESDYTAMTDNALSLSKEFEISRKIDLWLDAYSSISKTT